MTTLSKRIKCCAICGMRAEYGYVTSTNEFGSRDLDLRPAELYRSTIGLWVEECPHCGYVANDISKETPVSLDQLKAIQGKLETVTKYFISPLASSFLLHYVLLKKQNNPCAFFAIRNGAWACDDAYDEDNASKFRELALYYLQIEHKNIAQFYDKNRLELVRADFLRRTGRFSDVIRNYKGVAITDEELNKLFRYEVYLAEREDMAAHTCDEALEKRRRSEESAHRKKESHRFDGLFDILKDQLFPSWDEDEE